MEEEVPIVMTPEQTEEFLAQSKLLARIIDSAGETITRLTGINQHGEPDTKYLLLAINGKHRGFEVFGCHNIGNHYQFVCLDTFMPFLMSAMWGMRHAAANGSVVVSSREEILKRDKEQEQ